MRRTLALSGLSTAYLAVAAWLAHGLGDASRLAGADGTRLEVGLGHRFGGTAVAGVFAGLGPEAGRALALGIMLLPWALGAVALSRPGAGRRPLVGGVAALSASLAAVVVLQLVSYGEALFAADVRHEAAYWTSAYIAKGVLASLGSATPYVFAAVVSTAWPRWWSRLLSYLLLGPLASVVLALMLHRPLGGAGLLLSPAQGPAAIPTLLGLWALALLLRSSAPLRLLQRLAALSRLPARWRLDLDHRSASQPVSSTRQPAPQVRNPLP